MYTTVTEALAGLKTAGYTRDLNIAFDRILCADDECTLYAGDFEIEHIYRFEDDTDPGSQSAVYAVHSKDGRIKGVLVNGYGIYAADISDELLRALDISNTDELEP